MRLLVTRPEPDAGAQAEKLKSLGHDPLVSSLLTREFLKPRLPDLSRVQALIVTSRNGLRALEASGKLGAALGLPLFTVGGASAKLAKEMGFADIFQGSGTAKGLLPLIQSECGPGRGPLLHLAGEQVAFDLKGALEAQGFEAAQLALYRMRPAAGFSREARAALETGALGGVILMSPATARAYRALIAAEGLERVAANPAYYCLSDNVAAPLAGLKDAKIIIPLSPSEDDLLALTQCKTAKC